MEFPHLMRLIDQVQFDTVYHEHFSYLSLYTVGRIFKACGLRVYDVEQIPTPVVQPFRLQPAPLLARPAGAGVSQNY